MAHRVARHWWWGLFVVSGLVASSCTQAPTPTLPSYVPSAELVYLPSPLVGYPLTVDGDRAAVVRLAHAGLDREPAAASAAAAALLAEDGTFHPALVLSAQAKFLDDQDVAVLELLTSVVEAVPGYVAAQLVLGRAAERLGEDLVAWRAFRTVAGLSDLAARRAEELLPQGVEQLLNEVETYLERGQIEAVEPRLAELVEWVGAEDARVAEIELRLAVAAGDEVQQLTLIRLMLAPGGGRQAEDGETEFEPASDRWDLQVRLAALELEVGEVRQGIDLFEGLAEADPENQAVRKGLLRAKFFRHLQLLPVRVQELGRKPELDRADLATILYWVVPAVRYARVDNPPIANDILDHPQRDEMVRVAGLGLMRIDRTLHRFEPGRTATRRNLLLALLRVLAMAEKPVACLGEGEAKTLGRSSARVCEAAARCRLIPEAADCLPSATVSGADSRELLRLGLELLGSE